MGCNTSWLGTRRGGGRERLPQRGVERVGGRLAEVVWNLLIKAETYKTMLMIFEVSADSLSL